MVILANGLSASPQQSKPYFGLDLILALDFEPLCSNMFDPPVPPPVIDMFDIETDSLFPPNKSEGLMNIMKLIAQVLKIQIIQSSLMQFELTQTKSAISTTTTN